ERGEWRRRADQKQRPADCSSQALALALQAAMRQHCGVVCSCEDRVKNSGTFAPPYRAVTVRERFPPRKPLPYGHGSVAFRSALEFVTFGIIMSFNYYSLSSFA